MVEMPVSERRIDRPGLGLSIWKQSRIVNKCFEYSGCMSSSFASDDGVAGDVVDGASETACRRLCCVSDTDLVVLESGDEEF